MAESGALGPVWAVVAGVGTRRNTRRRSIWIETVNYPTLGERDASYKRDDPFVIVYESKRYGFTYADNHVNGPNPSKRHLILLTFDGFFDGRFGVSPVRKPESTERYIAEWFVLSVEMQRRKTVRSFCFFSFLSRILWRGSFQLVEVSLWVIRLAQR